MRCEHDGRGRASQAKSQASEGDLAHRETSTSWLAERKIKRNLKEEDFESQEKREVLPFSAESKRKA